MLMPSRPVGGKVGRCSQRLAGSAINPALKRGRYMSRFGSPAELPRNCAATAWKQNGEAHRPAGRPAPSSSFLLPMARGRHAWSPAVPPGSHTQFVAAIPQNCWRSRAINGGQLNTGTPRSWCYYSRTAVVTAAASSDLNVSRRDGLVMVSWPWQRPPTFWLGFPSAHVQMGLGWTRFVHKFLLGERDPLRFFSDKIPASRCQMPNASEGYHCLQPELATIGAPRDSLASCNR
jgi:hypothetical protein